MSKLERLLNLTAVLLDTDRPIPAEVIKRRVEGYPDGAKSFHRAFERDKEDLRSLGIPLRIDRVPGADPPLDGYRIPPEEYYLPDPGLDPDELAALHLASMAVRVDGLGEREALWKLGGLSDLRAEDMVGAVASVPTNPALVPLFGAVTARRQVRFTYNGEDRTVDPWRLDFQRGRWYLTAYDHLREDERNFRLDRIVDDVEIVGEPGSGSSSRRPATGRPLPAWQIGDETPTIVQLRVDPARVAWAKQQFGPDVSIEPEADGGAIFEVPVVMPAAFRSLVLEFLDHAEILGPPDVRDSFVAWLRSVIAAGDAR